MHEVIVMKEAVKNGREAGTKQELKYTILTDSDVERIMSNLGQYDEITHEELLQLSVERLQGKKVSDIIREERDEGY